MTRRLNAVPDAMRRDGAYIRVSAVMGRAGDDLLSPSIQLDSITAASARDGGTVVEVWNGRYGNKMKTQAMTYAEIQAALVEVDRMIAAEQAVSNGLPRRRPVAVRWNS